MTRRVGQGGRDRLRGMRLLAGRRDSRVVHLEPRADGIVGEGASSGRSEARQPLHKGVYILPNLFTSAGIVLGVYSILASARGDFWLAAICIVVAHVCDGLDGRIARLTHTTSQFGVEYDSLADLVAFGVAPGILVYRWALEPWGTWGWLAASLYVVCGALRLARFNVQVSLAEKRWFVGLPIPAAADMIAATVLVYFFFGGEGATNKHIVLLSMVYCLALLMVSNIPYYSFKEIDLRTRKPFYALVGILIFVKFVVAEPQILLFGTMLLYVGSGPVRGALALLRGEKEDAGQVQPPSTGPTPPPTHSAPRSSTAH